jgi:DNA-binding NarL/FixJ family response regulator
MPKKILIIEDHPIYAEALKAVIETSGVVDRVDHEQSLADAKDRLARAADYELALLDLWLPDTHGFEGLIELRKLFPKLPIVVVSAFADQAVVHKAIVCGAVGFIPKSQRKDALTASIRSVLGGGMALPPGYVPPEAAPALDLAALTGKLSSLTHQQLRVLHMLCQGLLNKQIAFELDVGETTVKAHVTEILRKLSVCSRTQAVLEISKLDFRAVLALYASGGEERPPSRAQTGG